MRTFLDFEKPVSDLEGQIQELRRLEAGDSVSVADEIKTLEDKAREALSSIYAKLTPWQKAQVARHPDRPHAHKYIEGLFDDFTPLAGDRKFGEDKAIVGGLARFRGEPVAVLCQEKGDDTQGRLLHNFGMARPEGYRKAVRIMALAERFSLPVISLVDTAGAYPGVDAEARGQAEAIARSTEAGLGLTVPNVAVIIGEGGSGGAIAIATANRVFMLEHAIYSVISPEGAASILWRDPARGAGRGDADEDHRRRSPGAESHRSDHHRAARRRAPGPGHGHRPHRRSHRQRAGGTRRPVAGRGGAATARQVPGDRPVDFLVAFRHNAVLSVALRGGAGVFRVFAPGHFSLTTGPPH